jgi:hypothetical protein
MAGIITAVKKVNPWGWRRQLFHRIEIFELAFARCNKLENPQEWLRLQDELGKMYKEIMEIYGKED